MIPAYTIKLGLISRSTNINISKIDNLVIKIYAIDTVGFLSEDRYKKVWFFKKTLLLADTSIDMVLEISSFILNNTNINFIEIRIFIRKN